MKRTALASAFAICFSAGCSNLPEYETLANLPQAAVPDEPQITLPQIDLAALQQNYRQALASNGNPATRRMIELRLADLEMERLEQLQADQPETIVSYASAVHHYEALVQQSPGDDYLLYRLARARAMGGDTSGSMRALEALSVSAPDSPFIVETLFRRGEAAFNRRDYIAATRDFSAVLEKGETPFAANARYMLGWSQFKSADYRISSLTFLQLLDELYAKGPLAELAPGSKRLAEDTLRVLALGFNYQGGAEAIESFNRDGQQRAYQHDLYMALGDWYSETERYLDSANTYLTYVRNYPDSEQAPALHVRAIEILQQGDFPSEVLPAKREFVQRYGIRGNYWQRADAAQREKLGSWLRPWLNELARFDHARAQSLEKQSLAKQASRKKLSARFAAESSQAYLAAANFYGEYAETFPQDKDTPGMVFLMAECFDQAGEYQRAWDGYRTVAWGFAAHAQAAEAGYAAILTAGKMQQLPIDEEQQTLWLDRKTETSLKFAESWPADPRALPVLLDAANNLFSQRRYPEAIAAAERAAQWQPQPDRLQRQNLNLVLGHSQFELQNFPAAELAYTQVLNESLPGDSVRETSRERLQVAIYQQAQALLTDGPNEVAIQHLLRVRDSGRSDTAATAQYDAINHLMTLEQWQRAGSELEDFRVYYSAHPLTASLPAKAVVIYQALALPGAAAKELLQLAALDGDPEVRRQSLYLAAEQYRELGERDKALAAFREYSNNWKQPAEQNLEAQYQLARLYEEAGNAQQRNFWLNSLARNNDKSPRSRYLAAYGQNALAEQSYQAFARMPLQLPLKTSLQNKKRALETTIADYRKVLDFNIAEFTTAANFRLAEVYRQLSKDLMRSQRPPGLNELELEQYEILLEEQAYPFEEKAIELHQANIQRTANGIYDDWVKRSFQSLGELLPARYGKAENTLGWSDAIY